VVGCALVDQVSLKLKHLVVVVASKQMNAVFLGILEEVGESYRILCYDVGVALGMNQGKQKSCNNRTCYHHHPLGVLVVVAMMRISYCCLVGQVLNSSMLTRHSGYSGFPQDQAAAAFSSNLNSNCPYEL